MVSRLHCNQSVLPSCSNTSSLSPLQACICSLPFNNPSLYLCHSSGGLLYDADWCSHDPGLLCLWHYHIKRSENEDTVRQPHRPGRVYRSTVWMVLVAVPVYWHCRPGPGTFCPDNGFLLPAQDCGRVPSQCSGRRRVLCCKLIKFSIVCCTLQFIIVLLVIVCRKMKWKMKKLERPRSMVGLVCARGLPAGVGQLAAGAPHAAGLVACVRPSVNNGAPCAPTEVARSVSPRKVGLHSQKLGQGTVERSLNPGLNCGL